MFGVKRLESSLTVRRVEISRCDKSLSQMGYWHRISIRFGLDEAGFEVEFGEVKVRSCNAETKRWAIFHTGNGPI